MSKLPSPLKAKLKALTPTLGSWLTLGHPAIAEILARAGFDWLAIDLEHSVMSIADAGELIRVIDLCGVAPLVRLTSNDANLIKRVMDSGAHGIIVPMVNSAADARAAVAATRYPPKGTRGVGLARAQGYGTTFESHLRWQETEPVVIAQIEHRDAVADIDAILAVDGIDGYLVGPYDLSCSMGIPGKFESNAFAAALETVRAAGIRARKAGGMHVVEPEPERLREALAGGSTFVAYGVDFRFLDVAARAGVGQLKRTA